MHRIKLCFGQVGHSRLKPIKNAFKYAVFNLRIPMRTRAQSKEKISSKYLGDNQFGLLSFFDKDHGLGDADSLKWALNLLKSEGIDDFGGEVWLHTFPRVFGYVFNPVSFWFFEDPTGDTRAILAEVNNTFGERHCYLLTNETQGFICAPMNWGATYNVKKVFHVSPFCDRVGNYNFRFFSTKSEGSNTPARHVSRIEYNDEEGPLLITSIGVKEEELDFKSWLKAMLSYPLMSFQILWKIHWQALKIWIKGVSYRGKPEQLPGKVTR